MSAFIDENRASFGVELICRTLGVSASAYYRRRTGARSARSLEDARLLERIRALHAQNYECYGYRRITVALCRDGEQVGRDHVRRLMVRAGIQGAKRRGKPWRTTIPDPEAQRAPDLLCRDVSAERPDAKWIGDFTYLRTWEGRVFFSFIVNVYSRMIVGWHFANHMCTDLVLDALRMALGTRRPGADFTPVAQTDAGSPSTPQGTTPRS